MSESEWRANIYDGIGCSLLHGDELLLLYIVDQGAIAKVDGKVLPLTGSKSGFPREGDRYEGNGISIEVKAAEKAPRTAVVSVQSGSRSETFKGVWGCGS